MLYTGTYGSHKTFCFIFEHDGYYCVYGSVNVNRTHDTLYDGIDVETLADDYCFTWNTPIESIEEFINAIES